VAYYTQSSTACHKIRPHTVRRSVAYYAQSSMACSILSPATDNQTTERAASGAGHCFATLCPHGVSTTDACIATGNEGVELVHRLHHGRRIPC